MLELLKTNKIFFMKVVNCVGFKVMVMALLSLRSRKNVYSTNGIFPFYFPFIYLLTGL